MLCKMDSFLPGQSLEQGLFWTGGPLQGWPPLMGLGLSQVLVLFCSPLPHLGEQTDHVDQPDHSPSTEKEEEQNE